MPALGGVCVCGWGVQGISEYEMWVCECMHYLRDRGSMLRFIEGFLNAIGS